MPIVLTDAVLNNTLGVESSSDYHDQYYINFRLALTYKQADELTRLFGMHYGTIVQATNWGTIQKFNIVIRQARFDVKNDLQNAFEAFLSHVHKTPYPTENNFDYYLDTDYKPD